MWALPASAADEVTYTGTTTAGSGIILHEGDEFELTINPTASVSATIDLTSNQITSASTTFGAAYSDTFSAPFNMWMYVQAQLEQRGTATGTATPTADPDVRDIALDVTNRLRVTVFKVGNNQPDPPIAQNPAVDQKFTLPERCWVDLDMTLSGTINTATGALSLSQNPFTIPPFPGDPGDTAFPGGTDAHRCQLATSALNEQLSGTNNSVDLRFEGELGTTTTTTTTTSTTSTSAPATSTTLATTSTTSATASTSIPDTTATSTTIEPSSTTSSSLILSTGRDNGGSRDGNTSPNPGARDSLPRTGSDALPLAVSGLAMVVLGGAILVRRRSVQHA